MNEIMVINGVNCYEQNGTAYLKLEDVARGLGFTKTENKNGTEYVTIRWNRIFEYLDEIGFDHKWSKDGFIPENIFYRLAMKAKNAVAEAFQAKVADEIIPSIRKTGGYIAGQETLSDAELMAKAVLIAQNTIAQRDQRIKALELENSALAVDKAIMQPKADYFDDLVDRNLLVNFTEASKQLGIKRKTFINFMLERGYLYRDKKNNLLPYANKKSDGLFEVKEASNQKTGWAGCQTLLTPKGVETFRLLCAGMA